MIATHKEPTTKDDIKEDIQRMRESSENLQKDLGELAQEVGVIARKLVNSTNEATKEGVASAAEMTKNQVHNKPIQSLAIALGAGLVLGAALFRRH